MNRADKVPLYIALKNLEALDAGGALLQRIEDELVLLERRLKLVDCRVTIEAVARGACHVRVHLRLPESRHEFGEASGSDAGSAIHGAFDAVGRHAIFA